MNPLQSILPATPPAAAKAPTASAAADAAAESEVPPWVAAFQAALGHAKSVKLPGVPLKTTAGADAATTDDKTDTATDAALLTAPAAPAIPLLATLPPPATATAPVACGDAARGHDSDLQATARTPRSDPGAIVEAQSADANSAGARVPAKTPHTGAEFSASSGEALRTKDFVAGRESNAHEINAQLPAQFALPQAAPAAAPAAAQPSVQLQLDAAVNSPAWNTELGQKVVWMVSEKQHVAELRVNTPDLGPLDIKLTISDNQTTAVFTSPHGAVRDAVESAIPRLREVLAESGIMLGNASVTADSPRDGSAFANPDGQPHRANGSARDADGAPAAVQTMAMRPRQHNGLVDLFA